MPSHSIKSASTVRTVDDVMSLMDVGLSSTASLLESREFVRKTTGANTILANSTIDELEDLNSILSPITPNTGALISSMLRCNAMLGGPQATSFFYPICELVDCPWDFFCQSNRSDEFIDTFRTSSGCQLMEDVKSTPDSRVVHFRRDINGSNQACSIRIFISDKHPLGCILGLKASYEQSMISAAAAVCFWPNLQRKKLYREFQDNPGTIAFPKGKSFYQINIRPGTKTSLKRPATEPLIHDGINKRLEVVVFKASRDTDNTLYRQRLEEIEKMVYSVFNTSTRYLGTLSGMK